MAMTISFQTILPASLWGWDGKNCDLFISFEAPELEGWKGLLIPFETTGLDIHVTHTIDGISFVITVQHQMETLSCKDSYIWKLK